MSFPRGHRHRRAISSNLACIPAIPSGRWINQPDGLAGGRRRSRPKNCEQQVAHNHRRRRSPCQHPCDLAPDLARPLRARSLTSLALTRAASPRRSRNARTTRMPLASSLAEHMAHDALAPSVALKTLSCFSCNADLTDKGLAHRVLCVQIEVSYGQFFSPATLATYSPPAAHLVRPPPFASSWPPRFVTSSAS